MHFYIDESGDLGFGSKDSTKLFVIAAVKVYDPLVLSRAIKRARHRKLKKSIKEKSEFKFSNTSPEIRERILRELGKGEIEVYALVLNKQKVKQDLRDKKNVLYSYLLKLLLEKCFKFYHKTEPIAIIFDRVFTKVQQEALQLYLLTQNRTLFESSKNLTILHENSERNSCLQAVDFIAGAIARKYERGDESYYRLVKNIIKVESSLFFDSK